MMSASDQKLKQVVTVMLLRLVVAFLGGILVFRTVFSFGICISGTKSLFLSNVF